MDYQAYLDWKKRKKKKQGAEVLQNTNFIFVNDAGSKKRKRGFTLWG